MIFAYPTFHRAVDSALWSPPSSAAKMAGRLMGQQGEVALAGHDGDRRLRDVSLEEGAVAGRPGVVVGALPDLDGDLDLLEREAPGVPEDPVVLHATFGALSQRLPDEGERVVGRAPFGEHCPVGGRERAHDGPEAAARCWRSRCSPS